MFRDTLLLTLTASAALMGQTAGKTEPATAAPPEKKLCRKLEVTGSIMGGKTVCHTKSEWAAIDTANGNAARESRDPNGRFGGFREGR